MPVEQAKQSGLAPDQVSINEKYGGGYPANVEGLHQLHCLVSGRTKSRDPNANAIIKNLLRQTLHWNYDYYHGLGQGAFKNDDFIVRRHTSKYTPPYGWYIVLSRLAHCLDIIRQQLMCTVDIGVLGQVWLYPQRPEAYVDFNTQHRCRNFEDVRRWAEENQLPENVPDDFLARPKRGDRVYEEIP